MKILGIDTSTKYLGVAVIDDGEVLTTFRDTGELRHYSYLIPAIDQALKRCGLKLEAVQAIALSIGPGSFTGLRIGTAAVKAINLALGTPIVAVPTLDAVAYNFLGEKERILCPLIDAKKEKLYACFYGQNLERLTDYMLTDIENFLKMIDKPTLVFGDAVLLYGDYIKRNPLLEISRREWFPQAEVVAKIALRKASRKEFADPDKLVPMYLHSKYCQVTKQKTEDRRQRTEKI